MYVIIFKQRTLIIYKWMVQKQRTVGIKTLNHPSEIWIFGQKKCEIEYIYEKIIVISRLFRWTNAMLLQFSQLLQRFKGIGLNGGYVVITELQQTKFCKTLKVLIR